MEVTLKPRFELRQHVMRTHNINVKLIKCPEADCESQFKTNGELEQHLMKKHNIGVKFFECMNDFKSSKQTE